MAKVSEHLIAEPNPAPPAAYHPWHTQQKLVSPIFGAPISHGPVSEVVEQGPLCSATIPLPQTTLQGFGPQMAFVVVRTPGGPRSPLRPSVPFLPGRPGAPGAPGEP